MDKNTAMITFLQTCPVIQQNALFFNFGNVENNAHQVSTNSDEIALEQPYIDGSVLKRFTFTVDSFKSIAYNPVVTGRSDENISDFKDVQDLSDWINTQGDNRVYPNFGTDCIIDKMETLTSKPELLEVDSSIEPPIATYRITIQIDYIDTTKMLWK